MQYSNKILYFFYSIFLINKLYNEGEKVLLMTVWLVIVVIEIILSINECPWPPLHNMRGGDGVEIALRAVERTSPMHEPHNPLPSEKRIRPRTWTLFGLNSPMR